MENHIDVLVARSFDEHLVLKALYPGQWVSYFTIDESEEPYLCSKGFLELSLAGVTPVMVPVTLAFDEHCLEANAPDGTIIACGGGRYVKVAGAFHPVHLRDYVFVDRETAAKAQVEWLRK